MFFALFFAFWRFMQIITLIPTMGMLAYFVNGYNSNNLLTPTYILLLFIVSVLALAWAVVTLFAYHRSASNAKFIGVIDLGFVGAFIAGVYYLRFIANANCTSIAAGSTLDVSFGIFGSASINGFNVSIDKTCAILKACFAFGIMNTVFFFITAILGWTHGDRMAVVEEKRYYTETRRRGHSRHRHSHSGSRHGSRRSSHSHSRAYL